MRTGCLRCTGGRATDNYQLMNAMETITKRDVVKAVAQATGLDRAEVSTTVDGLLTVVTDHLASGNKVEFRGFGSFLVQARSARTGRNPATGEAIQIPARNVPLFRASTSLKRDVNS